MPARRRPPARKDHRSPAVLVDLTDQELLDLRLKDLGLTVEGSAVEPRLERLAAELDREGLFQPYAWLSTDWFTPDGCTGFAVPFYLAHSRLVRLERAQMLEVEGGSADECLRILRHEAAHAIDNAYGLRRRKRWRQLFGSPSTPYPEFYRPNPASKRYVQHLDRWYAQAHPAEDFAETFAVWLTPRSAWRKHYEGWPALKKLEYVDELMASIADAPHVVRSKAKPYAACRVRKSLRSHYEERRNHYSVGYSNAFDRDLNRLFDAGMEPGTETAAKFLRRNRREIREVVSRWTGDYIIAVDAILNQMIGRCRELKLRTKGGESTKNEFMVMLTMHSMTYVYKGRDRRPV